MIPSFNAIRTEHRSRIAADVEVTKNSRRSFDSLRYAQKNRLRRVRGIPGLLLQETWAPAEERAPKPTTIHSFPGARKAQCAYGLPRFLETPPGVTFERESHQPNQANRYSSEHMHPNPEFCTRNKIERCLK